MKQIILTFVCVLFSYATTFAQYKVTKRTTVLCDLPECQEEYKAKNANEDSSVLGFTADRSLEKMQEKGGAESSGSTQNIFFIESLNSILFIPQSFVPLKSSFYISGATDSIIKIQIFNVSKELVFQTSIADNAWNGVWKSKPQYGIFNYKITVKVDENSSEVIEGLIVTKKPN